jgi:trk system potassium uptake protein TrkH
MPRRWRPGPTSLLLGSFGGLILLGTFLLRLPPLQAEPVGLLDCLFTAASAVCVTGLITVDTATAWSPWGQGLILLMFQLGGLGIMTFSLAMLYLAGLRPGLIAHLAVGGSLGFSVRQDLGRLARNVIVFTLGAELLGAVVLGLRFGADHPPATAAALGAFHAVSAFCNAGFSLFSDSLQAYAADPVVNLTVMALIVLGGLGFVAVGEVASRWRRRGRGRPPRLSLHTRLVLTTSLVLIAGGAAAMWAMEQVAGGGPVWGGGWWASLFTSVTARTAGFNTAPMTELSNASLLLVMGLMFVGASPGSCGGGIKTTALASLYAVARARLGGLATASLYRRGIEDRQVGEAVTLAACSLLVVLAAVVALELTEQGAAASHHRGRVLVHAFEAVSAFATVGLSLGATEGLTPAGKLVVIVVMFVGRLGPLTFVYALLKRARAAAYTPAKEKIMLG